MLMMLGRFWDVGKNPTQLMLMMLGRFGEVGKNPAQLMLMMLGRFWDVAKNQAGPAGPADAHDAGPVLDVGKTQPS